MKGIFLGAGASYECGMPLVWEFTNVLRSNVLKRLDTNLFDFSKEPSFRGHFEEIISNPDFHYEQMIGELETIYLERGKSSDTARAAALQLVDCVQILLLEDQGLTTGLFSEKAKDYSGISGLLNKNPHLHVFSLNHDINFEEICKIHNVGCRDGFFEQSNERYSNIARFKSLTKKQMNTGKFNFFDSDETGINLIKLHGSLDTFAVEDKETYLKCYPSVDAPIGAHFREIRKIEDHSLQLSQQTKVRTVGELHVTDRNGELQFLRRSLLSGAHKFKGTFDQIAPLAFFEEFKKRIELITELDVIGYGFGDKHINEVLDSWLTQTNSTLNIYDPFRKTPPPELPNHAENIKIINMGLTGYLQSFSLTKESLFARARRHSIERAREQLKKKRLATWRSDNDSAG
ncbi:hypothetical protein C7A11_28010 [Pseudomonas simiae]|uniref:hypothetical protein n=1 Tax=Pseudomonas simiae TaxID=321846 RepID=UPI000D02C3CB|nr:hypothetical protein [Pseudomonas simiae]PRW84017.1 hypothetical protein C7A11_28010 [Pseudomonas simiae]